MLCTSFLLLNKIKKKKDTMNHNRSSIIFFLLPSGGVKSLGICSSWASDQFQAELERERWIINDCIEVVCRTGHPSQVGSCARGCHC